MATPEYIRVGSISRSPIGELADIAARRLLTLQRPQDYAVTLEPNGIVMIEPVEEAVDDEIVGIYDPNTIDGEGVLVSMRVFKRIREDLAQAASQRPVAA